jgi:hypothetical protein
LYITVKVDWANIIGKWFPWTTVKSMTTETKREKMTVKVNDSNILPAAS